MKVSRGVQDRTNRNLYLHKKFMSEGLSSKEAYDKLLSLSEYLRKKSFEHHKFLDRNKNAKSFADIKP